MPHRPSEQTARFKCAFLGMWITLAPVATLACAQLLLAPHTVAAVFKLDPKIDAWAVSALRSSLVEAYSIIATILIVCWLLTATLSRGQFLKIKSANVALVLAGVTFAFEMAIVSMVQTPARLLKAACPFFGLPDTMPALPPGMFRFDGQTPCEAFAIGAVPKLLPGLPLTLLTTSVILRIVVSRRR